MSFPTPHDLAVLSATAAQRADQRAEIIALLIQCRGRFTSSPALIPDVALSHGSIGIDGFLRRDLALFWIHYQPFPELKLVWIAAVGFVQV
jgi:hypothetical protein